MQKLFIGKGKYVDQQGTEKKKQNRKDQIMPSFQIFR